MQADIGTQPDTGDLRHWAAQGVLLLNTSLSVPEGNVGAHAKLGWAKLTAQVMARVSTRPTAFVLWGKHAQGMAKHISKGDHLMIQTAHPSPLSASRGFFGSRPFSKVNDWLTSRGEQAINWGA